jgi:hypothetical protein
MKLISIAALTLMMTASVFAQDLFVKKGIFSPYETATEKLQKITAKNTVGEYPILRVGDEMRLLMSKVNYSTGTVGALGRVVLFTSRDKKFHAGLDMTANLEQTNAPDWVDTPCKREDFLWKRSVGEHFRNVNCVSINHFVNFAVNPTGEFQQIVALIKDEGIEITPTMIRTIFTRYTSGGRRLVYTVDINPEHYGIERDATTIWGASGWYKDFIKRDTKKLEFIERLKKWATDVQDRMDSAFKKDGKAFVDLKSLDEYLVGSESKGNEVKEQGSLAEEKLSKLKSLYEKGLLTETQYNEQVKTILNKN